MSKQEKYRWTTEPPAEPGKYWCYGKLCTEPAADYAVIDFEPYQIDPSHPMHEQNMRDWRRGGWKHYTRKLVPPPNDGTDIENDAIELAECLDGIACCDTCEHQSHDKKQECCDCRFYSNFEPNKAMHTARKILTEHHEGEPK